MKEATGELNMTVVVVLAIAALATFFFSFLWPLIQGNFKRDSRCDDAICPCPEVVDGKCVYKGRYNEECYFKDNPNQKITCSWKG